MAIRSVRSDCASGSRFVKASETDWRENWFDILDRLVDRNSRRHARKCAVRDSVLSGGRNNRFAGVVLHYSNLSELEQPGSIGRLASNASIKSGQNRSA